MTKTLAADKQFYRDDFLQDAQTIEPLFTNITGKQLINDLDYKILTFGSCFAQNLQKVISRFGIDVYFERNSCAHYTTSSLLQLLQLAAGEKQIADFVYALKDDDSDVIAYPFFRLRLYGENARERVIAAADALLQELVAQIKQRDMITITLGTTVTFELQGNIVAALNGMPLHLCERNNFMSVQTIVSDLGEINRLLTQIRGNGDFTTIYTVSPQRYNWREQDTGMGFLQFNTLSKSTLVVAVNEFVSKTASEQHIYFPSYEIVTEELRQYETLATYDHLHINSDTTPKYVVKRFLNIFASEHVLAAFVELDNLRSLVDFSRARMNAGATFDSEYILPSWHELLEKARDIDARGDIGVSRVIEQKMAQIRAECTDQKN